MVSPIYSIHGRTVLDINVTVNQHRNVTPDLSRAIGLDGCDTVVPTFSTGKTVALTR